VAVGTSQEALAGLVFVATVVLVVLLRPPAGGRPVPPASRRVGDASATLVAGRPPAAGTAARDGTRPAVAGADTRARAEAFEARVVALINARRASSGCRPLTVDPRLAAAARAHSVDMAAHRYFGHDALTGETPFARITDAGYRYSAAAENIAAGQPDPAQVVAAWMDSPGHRSNILNCALRQTGVGFATGGTYGAYWTQDFGAP
jgi:uncharacterized protein YkwD